MKKIFIPIFLFFLFSGCSLYQITSEETTFDYYPPKASKDDVGYFEEVTQPHKVIGYVTINTERRQKKNDILNQLKEQAAKIGGDAITNITAQTSQGRKPIKLLANANIRSNYMADVIIFGDSTDEPTKTPSEENLK